MLCGTIFQKILPQSGEKEYYQQQFATLRSFEEVDSLLTNGIDGTDEDQEQEEQAQQETAIRISNIANVILLALKVGRLLPFPHGEKALFHGKMP